MNLGFLVNIQVASRDFGILDELGVFGEYPSIHSRDFGILDELGVFWRISKEPQRNLV